MNKRNDMIVQWAVNKIEKEYKDDVSLLLTYGSYENGTANPMSDVDFYFIPKTERAYELCKTFIIEGIGYDLFPMSWERVEGLAEINEFLIPCLGNVRMLYCNCEEDKKRFEQLQKRLKKNLSDKAFMLNKASELMEKASNVYQNLLFQENICELRAYAGYLLIILADVVAYSNQTYFKKGLKLQLEDLKNLASTPESFVLLYEAVVKANSIKEIKDYCLEIMKNTRSFIKSKQQEQPKEEEVEVNYKALAELYQEIISTWNKIYVCCGSGNASLAFISGVCLQDELHRVSERYSLKKFDLMSSFDAQNLKPFKAKAEEIQKEFVKLVEDNGAAINEYSSVEEFLKVN